MIEGMINRAEFRFNDPVVIDVPSQLSSTAIYLRMRGTHSEQTSFYPISGFPRRLIAEDKINGTFFPMTMTLHMLTEPPETRLDKRAELIKERRYGGLAIANDPRLAVPNDEDRPPGPLPKHSQDANGEGKDDSTLAKADTGESTDTSTSITASSRLKNSRGSSQSSISQLSGDSSTSASKPPKIRASISDLEAEAQVAARDGYKSPISIDDGDELARNMSGIFSLGVKEPDFGSDDSDGPPEDEEEDEMEMEKTVIVS